MADKDQSKKAQQESSDSSTQQMTGDGSRPLNDAQKPGQTADNLTVPSVGGQPIVPPAYR